MWFVAPLLIYYEGSSTSSGDGFWAYVGRDDEVEPVYCLLLSWVALGAYVDELGVNE